MAQPHLVGGLNLLEMVPKRRAGYRFNRDGTVTIYMPRFTSGLGIWLCRISGLRNRIPVRLDKYGSYLWTLCNGKFTVKEIGRRMEKRFGKEVGEKKYERLAEFIGTLEANRFIEYL